MPFYCMHSFAIRADRSTLDALMDHGVHKRKIMENDEARTAIFRNTINTVRAGTDKNPFWNSGENPFTRRSIQDNGAFCNLSGENGLFVGYTIDCIHTAVTDVRSVTMNETDASFH